ncbi:hypothetical protein B0H14DRAFT_2728898, partial [Mycena olivaceomarginata]
LCPCSRYVARHLTSAPPPPLPIATSAPHPANVSSGDIDLRRLSPHPDGIRLVLGLSVTRSLAARGHGHHRATPRPRVRSRPRESHQRQHHSPQQLQHHSPLQQHHSPVQHHPSRFRRDRAGASRAGSPGIRHSARSQRTSGARTAYCTQHPASSTVLILKHGPDMHLGRLIPPPSTRRARGGAGSTSAGKALKLKEGEKEGDADARPRMCAPAKGYVSSSVVFAPAYSTC